MGLEVLSLLQGNFPGEVHSAWELQVRGGVTLWGQGQGGGERLLSGIGKLMVI